MYPFTLEPDETGELIVEFRDVPGVLTSGADEAEGPGRGSPDRRARRLYRAAQADPQAVALPPLVAAKLALHEAMREAGLSNVALAERLGVSEPIVRRLLDLDHRSHIRQVDAALRALGKRLTVKVRDVAWVP